MVVKTGIYQAMKADLESRKRRHRDHKPSKPIWKFIKDRQVLKDSPKQISLHLRRAFGVSISDEWIYQAIYTYSKNGGSLPSIFDTHIELGENAQQKLPKGM